MPRRSKEATPRWVESRQHWRLDVQQGGRRKSFYSSDPRPRIGASECRQKARDWLDNKTHERSPTVAWAWQKFAADYKMRNKITSYNTMMSRGKAHIERKLAKRSLSDIHKADWQAVIDRAYRNGATSTASLKGIATTIRTFCKFCASHGWIADSDVPLYFRYPRNSTKKNKRALQPDELKTLFADCQDDRFTWWMPMFRFILLTGLRRGEFCALQEARDREGDRITIRESIAHEGVVTDGKTKNAARDIYLADDALAQIEQHHIMRRSKRHVSVIRSKYLFCSPDGGRVEPRHLRNVWQRWREANDIDITLHELRHTYITYTRTRTSIELADLKEIYGHSAKMDTDATYVHNIELTPEERIALETKKRHESKAIASVFEKIIHG